MNSAAITPDDVLFDEDLAKLLKTSVRTIKRCRAEGRDLPPEMARIDLRHRYLRSKVEAWMQESDVARRFGRSVARRVR